MYHTFNPLIPQINTFNPLRHEHLHQHTNNSTYSIPSHHLPNLNYSIPSHQHTNNNNHDPNYLLSTVPDHYILQAAQNRIRENNHNNNRDRSVIIHQHLGTPTNVHSQQQCFVFS